jgi:hypothetical protein
MPPPSPFDCWLFSTIAWLFRWTTIAWIHLVVATAFLVFCVWSLEKSSWDWFLVSVVGAIVFSATGILSWYVRRMMV